MHCRARMTKWADYTLPMWPSFSIAWMITGPSTHAPINLPRSNFLPIQNCDILRTQSWSRGFKQVWVVSSAFWSQLWTDLIVLSFVYLLVGCTKPSWYILRSAALKLLIGNMYYKFCLQVWPRYGVGGFLLGGIFSACKRRLLFGQDPKVSCSSALFKDLKQPIGVFPNRNLTDFEARETPNKNDKTLKLQLGITALKLVPLT